MDEDFRLEPQQKPTKSLNFQEKVKAGLVSGNLKKTRLNKFSKKTKERLDTYRELDKLQDDILICEVCGAAFHKDELDKHHPFGQGKHVDKFIYIKRIFHDWIHANSKLAYALGWLQPEYRKLPHDPNHPVPFKLYAFNCCNTPIGECKISEQE